MARTRGWIAVALVATGVIPAGVAGQAVEATVEPGPDGTRILRHEVVVDATPEEVWERFSTSEGLRSFAAPVAAIDLRIGGVWEASYDRHASLGDDANILNEVLSYLPREMLSIRVREAPPDFPFPDVIRQVWTVFQIEPVEGGTRVTSSMLGWREGEEWEAVLRAFERDNTTVFQRLKHALEEGPVDWSRGLGGGD